MAALGGPLAAPLEPAYDELNPPLEPPKEYRLSLGATVYLGSQEYELLAFDEQTVRLYDPSFPIINKEMARDEFDRKLAENPLNDKLLHVVEDAVPVADAKEPDAGEPPDAPLPVGRIDFLGTNGSVGESVEYTDAEEFVAGDQGRKPCWRTHADRPLPGRPGPDHPPGLPCRTGPAAPGLPGH